jgi:tryptophan halogenase
MSAVEDVLILGGGTAGWITACVLAQRLATARGGPRVTLIESSDIGIVGVGEGTFPTIRRLLASLGRSEAEFMRTCSATFKQGARFEDWLYTPAPGLPKHGYNHPFCGPEPTESGIELLPYWLMGVAGGAQYTRAVGLGDKVYEALRGPKLAHEPPFSARLNYAYHFDAGLMATWLAEVGQGLGVRRLLGNVETVNLAPDGSIASLDTREHGRLTAGLYVDCSGFRSALLGEALGSPFRDISNTLFVDRALAMPVPYADPKRPLACQTLSTAREAGWIWDIGLNDRRGVGHVYSSRYTDETRAEAVLRDYIGPEAEGLTPRLLKFQLGYRERSWVKNCVRVGLSAGFLEPLESTGIVMIGVAADLIADMFPRTTDAFEPSARAFNRAIVDRFLGQIDFLKLHYCLSQRRDNAFWIDNADRSTWTDSLTDRLDQWRERPPSQRDFHSAHETFTLFSHNAVLYGMGFQTSLKGREMQFPHVDEARRAFARIAGAAERASTILPDHRALVEEVYAQASPETLPPLWGKESPRTGAA